MTDPQRYLALIKRQQNKLKYAPIIEAEFHDAVGELGPNPSLNELSKWLTGRVGPSATANLANWRPQTVHDWLWFDGEEPTEGNLETFVEKGRTMTKSQIRQWRRKMGFRVNILEMWNRVQFLISADWGEDRMLYLERELHAHLVEIEKVARRLRAALLIPTAESPTK